MQLYKDLLTLTIVISFTVIGWQKVNTEEAKPEPVPIVTETVEPVREEVIPREIPKEVRYEETIKQYAERRVTETFGANQWGSFDSIVSRESRWDSNAQNRRSTAYGLGQFLDKTWAGTGIAKTSDPKQQIEAMLVYLKNRYGSPNNGWAHWQKHHWY